MSYKTIVVNSDGAANAACLDVAADLAERFGAHLVGVHARPPLEAPVFLEGSLPMNSLVKAYEQTAQAETAAASAAFDKAIRGRHLSSEWRVAEGPPADELAIQARYADLLVMSQADPQSTVPQPDDLVETVALSTGRPIVVVPHIGVARRPGRTVLLCWNASREAARAASDALPFLRQADKVIVLVIDPKVSANGHGAEPGADVATWLARQGVKVTVQRDVATASDVGNVILSRAADHDADLIVMGVYGHSRLRELVLGGASRTVLSTMTVPVLMTH